jgi:hypothetical protein
MFKTQTHPEATTNKQIQLFLVTLSRLVVSAEIA